ncbi:MAG TPA: hypothetical protein VM287_02220 [Egibacteraceae bacterium]|nr:hypothetical protein [Egibacteraceae bacterium]
MAEAREVRAGSLQLEQELHGLLGVAECALLAGDEGRAADVVAEAEPLLAGWLPFRWRAELTLCNVRCRLVAGEAEELLERPAGRLHVEGPAGPAAHPGG